MDRASEVLVLCLLVGSVNAGADPGNDPTPSSPVAAAATPVGFGNGPPGFPGRFGARKQQLSLIGGYGSGLPIGASDSDELEVVTVRPRWAIGLTDLVYEDRWYRGNLDLVVEGEYAESLEPEDGFAAGLNLLLRYNFLRESRLIPFVQIGGGALATDFDVEDQDDGFNFSLQGGVGAHYFLSEQLALLAEWRLHHVSNAGIKNDNAGLNTSTFLFGFTFFP